jgi:UDP-3-O-[3-hydroxymyristoyl] glucosamine N-acyltransferase
LQLRELCARLGAELRGDGDVEVLRLSSLQEAGPGDLTFLANRQYLRHLATTRAAAVIVSPGVDTPLPSVIIANPYLAYSRAAALLHPEPAPTPGVHPSAVVDPSAVLDEGVHVGPLAVIGPGVRVGPRTVIHPHVVLYPGVSVGEDCVLHSGVQVREGCRLGDRVVVQNGAVIGADGFGFARDGEGRYHKIRQVGIVVVEDDVEIGANTCLDRAALHETRIGAGTKLDNLVQIGHSVLVGRDTVMAGQVGIAGSTKIGSGVVLAGQVGVAGHIEIADRAIATAQTGIAHDVAAGAVVSGSPALPNKEWLRASVALSRLPELIKRVRELERKLGQQQE